MHHQLTYVLGSAGKVTLVGEGVPVEHKFVEMVVDEPVHGYIAGGVIAEPQTPLTGAAADLCAQHPAASPPF